MGPPAPGCLLGPLCVVTHQVPARLSGLWLCLPLASVQGLRGTHGLHVSYRGQGALPSSWLKSKKGLKGGRDGWCSGQGS